MVPTHPSLVTATKTVRKAAAMLSKFTKPKERPLAKVP
jgi:hypothetical protein